MGLSRIREYLLPSAAEREERCRQELLKLSRVGIQTLGALEIAAPVLMYFARPDPASQSARLWQSAALMMVGAATSAAARLKAGRQHARLLAVLSVWCAAAILVWIWPGPYIPAAVTLMMLTVVATVPVLPIHTLALGLSIEIVYAISVWTGEASHSHHFFLLAVTLASTGITVVVYVQRQAEFRARDHAIRVAEALAGAQLRAQLVENAAAIGKMAAAVTHEINTPLGAMKSAIDTLLVLASRQATAPPEKQQRMVEVQAELRRSIQASSERIQNVVARLQRFINLEEAELKSANLNELLSDVAVLFEDQIKGGIRLEFDLQPLPMLTCRPQLLTAVFSSLLSNAINAVNGEGRVIISTRNSASGLEVTIQDNGGGMSPEVLENIFDPGFRVFDKRVSSGNWSLFNSRQIIFEHGGDIQIESAEARGTTVRITLPAH